MERAKFKAEPLQKLRVQGLSEWPWPCSCLIPWYPVCPRPWKQRGGVGGGGQPRNRSCLLTYLFPRNSCGDCCHSTLSNCLFFFFNTAVAWVAFEIRAVYGGLSSVAGTPDDVVAWLLAVYLLVCRYQHSVLEFSGTTLFHPPPPPHLNISN